MFIMSVLLGRIGIIKAENELPLELNLIELVEESRLGMTNMQIPTSLGWKSNDNLALDSVWQLNELALFGIVLWLVGSLHLVG